MILISENGYLFGCREAVLVTALGGDQLSRAPPPSPRVRTSERRLYAPILARAMLVPSACEMAHRF